MLPALGGSKDLGLADLDSAACGETMPIPV